MNKRSERCQKGLSLIEILVVITIFSMLGLLISSSLILTIRGARKSESLVKVRENLNYAVAVIERNVRNANSIYNCSGEPSSTISYFDQFGQLTSFSCLNDESVGYVASGSGNIRMTSDGVDVGSCSFTCNDSNPPSVIVSLEGRNANASGIETSVVSISSTVYLRNNY